MIAHRVSSPTCFSGSSNVVNSFIECWRFSSERKEKLDLVNGLKRDLAELNPGMFSEFVPNKKFCAFENPEAVSIYYSN